MLCPKAECFNAAGNTTIAWGMYKVLNINLGPWTKITNGIWL